MTQQNQKPPRDIRQIRIRLGNWRPEAFSRDELYDDCELLLDAYDQLVKENAKLKAQVEMMKESLRKIQLQDRSRGYPTPSEWQDRVNDAKACLDKLESGEKK